MVNRKILASTRNLSRRLAQRRDFGTRPLEKFAALIHAHSLGAYGRFCRRPEPLFRVPHINQVDRFDAHDKLFLAVFWVIKP
jgi:hypothetical protein